MPRHDAELNLPREAADFLPAPFLDRGEVPRFFGWIGLLFCGGLLILMFSCALAIFRRPEVRYVHVPVQPAPHGGQPIAGPEQAPNTDMEQMPVQEVPQVVIGTPVIQQPQTPIVSFPQAQPYANGIEVFNAQRYVTLPNGMRMTQEEYLNFLLQLLRNDDHLYSGREEEDTRESVQEDQH